MGNSPTRRPKPVSSMQVQRTPSIRQSSTSASTHQASKSAYQTPARKPRAPIPERATATRSTEEHVRVGDVDIESSEDNNDSGNSKGGKNTEDSALGLLLKFLLLLLAVGLGRYFFKAVAVPEQA